MLGKIIKHEFRATWKKICGMYAIMIISLLVAMVSFNLEDIDLNGTATDIFRIILGISMLVLVVSLTAAFVIILVLLCQRFYQSVYSNQGYLTMTLPVSKFSILNGKLITYVIWSIVTVFVIVPCAWGYICFVEKSNDFMDLFRFIGDYIENCDDILYELILPIINLLFIPIRLYLYIFACLSLGQLSNKHKIGMAVAWSFFLRVGEMIITGLISVLFVPDTNPVSLVMIFFRITSGDVMRRLNLFSLIGTLIIVAIYYMITALIMNKKVNLQ